MDPVKALKQKIQSLQQELELHYRALKLIQPEEEKHEKARQQFTGDDVQAGILEFFEKKNPKGGVLIKDIARSLHMPYATVYDAVRVLERKKIVEQSNKPKKQYRRFRLKDQDKPTKVQAQTDAEKVAKIKDEIQGKGKSSKERSKRFATGGKKVDNVKLGKERHDKALEYAKTHEVLTVHRLARYTNMPHSAASDQIRKLVSHGRIEFTHEIPPTTGKGRNQRVYKSKIYRPTIAHAGHGTRQQGHPGP